METGSRRASCSVARDRKQRGTDRKFPWTKTKKIKSTKNTAVAEILPSPTDTDSDKSECGDARICCHTLNHGWPVTARPAEPSPWGMSARRWLKVSRWFVHNWLVFQGVQKLRCSPATLCHMPTASIFCQWEWLIETLKVLMDFKWKRRRCKLGILKDSFNIYKHWCKGWGGELWIQDNLRSGAISCYTISSLSSCIKEVSKRHELSVTVFYVMCSKGLSHATSHELLRAVNTIRQKILGLNSVIG